jgi:hypothetical protein
MIICNGSKNCARVSPAQSHTLIASRWHHLLLGSHTPGFTFCLPSRDNKGLTRRRTTLQACRRCLRTVSEVTLSANAKALAGAVRALTNPDLKSAA